MVDSCVHCLTELEQTPNICTRCRSVREYKGKTIVDDKGIDCKQYCPKCKEHPNMIFRGFKNPMLDSWCIGISINSNKPKEPEFMPFTKYNTLITSQQSDDRKVKGGSWQQMKDRYYEKWIAYDEGKYCGGW